jgi:hypothetical protein
MSHLTPRWVLGTARLRVVTFMRSTRGRLRRRPASARVVPRPARALPGARTLRLARVVVASDLNPRYLDCWPLARRAWPAIAGIEPLLVLVAPEADVPAELRSDPQVHVFEPLAGIHTAFQAQCIRLLQPALLDGDRHGAVLTADVDMLPLAARYFHEPVAHVDESHFVAYRDVLLDVHEVPICYNAALPATWGEIFGVSSLADVHARLREWSAGLDYDGVRGGSGWATDQLVLYRTLVDWGRRTRRAWILSDFDTAHRRLDRGQLEKPRALTARQEDEIRRGRYSDFHAVLPHDEFRELNERVIELAGG